MKIISQLKDFVFTYDISMHRRLRPAYANAQSCHSFAARTYKRETQIKASCHVVVRVVFLSHGAVSWSAVWDVAFTVFTQ